ncbi:MULTISPECIES: DUF305 domain-containing protein [unclassified Streptomyces]|uniref:DUF305 domain-containing protein n=1 Tax=unclassified Streptomyces TaxID=2593676 RepID=UPI0001C1D52B|nr:MULTISPECIES: DUF305 domain-containing protein [unclassified Streptomyces]AEN13615.1 protein of unknown function DUF305 [Streptomyces sp. SirexAA-E]MYR70610.1 DUF305 domain-containing protein [Streptomyces sp. SID4939]MYS00676.1 DUF305 domain-containing protein [Streptomyces sp. SID4940]MYT67508.1 DUF305 domain-containing protein [Streptomyces sp. SID8357]MYT86352.1 DUF305 domain-containing protein [Streptomyces sp. SID8360]
MTPASRASRPLVTAGVVVFLVAVGLVLLMVVRPSAASPSGSGASVSVPAEGSADVGFARDMSVHHQQAVEMAFLVRDRTDDEDVRRLAYDIINTQANQRGMMLGWLESWDRPKSSERPPMEWMGHPVSAADGSLMPGMATDSELDGLRAAEGRDAEVRFLRLMTVHHRAGADMARAAADSAGTDEIRNLAAGMARAQESEIALMADMLRARGARP